ncbi:hypothetical protein [Actinoplanes sp. NPDC023714]|uniref:hypothetical protein n=1 Tax=Actinoplanes sp. NPDC023714 TaxID=3154322 RepID=UPI003405C1DA
MTAPARTVPALVVLGSLIAVAGCGILKDSGEEAREIAVEAARHVLEENRDSLTAVLRQEGRDDQRLRAAAEEALTGSGDWYALIGVTTAARQVEARMVFYGRGEAGGGGTYKDYIVALCATISGTAGPGAEARAGDLTCPGTLPSSRRFSSVNEIVTLGDD